MKLKNTIAIAMALMSFASVQPASAALRVVTTTADLGALVHLRRLLLEERYGEDLVSYAIQQEIRALQD